MGDAQGLARLVLGNTARTHAGARPFVTSVTGKWAHGDAQQEAQRVLLGRVDVVAARS
jgi:hypothetical protein